MSHSQVAIDVIESYVHEILHLDHKLGKTSRILRSHRTVGAYTHCSCFQARCSYIIIYNGYHVDTCNAIMQQNVILHCCIPSYQTMRIYTRRVVCLQLINYLGQIKRVKTKLQWQIKENNKIKAFQSRPLKICILWHAGIVQKLLSWSY